MERVLIEGLFGSDGLQKLLKSKSLTSFALACLIPLCISLLLGICRLRRGRVCETDRVRIAPLLMFFSLLTDSANADNEKLLVSLLHPSLLEEGMVEPGVLQATARCLCDKFGKLVSISNATIRVARSGRQTNCEGLVDFEHVKQVWCHLSWVWRPIQTRQWKDKSREESGTSRFSASGINLDILNAFYVTDFHVELKKGDCLNLEKYVNPDDFQSFAKSFVKRIFEKPPTDAVGMMMPTLQKAYLKNNVNNLQEEIQQVLNICGGLAHGVESTNWMDAILVERKTVSSMPKVRVDGDVGEDTSTKENRMATAGSIEVLCQIGGGTHDIEVSMCITFYGLHCVVTQYEVRPKSDEPSKNIVE
ncbi:unnamed protein product [Phytomonas sp. EM1]|nr:unnamed protein product [Phytomonas sp. EM1]|eukprot:CCW64331.1 unnamed protein product [Phytomonas sp. isolate EM1]